MVNISDALASPTIEAIEAAVIAAEHREFDQVVRGSSIGVQCERDLWYRFRWARWPEQFEGRILRLFDTGHVEERRMIAWLRLAGVNVQDVDPETGDQWEVETLGGHFKGHLDGIVAGILEAPKTPHLLECKTHNTKSFTQLKKHGVAVAKPEHVAQMQVYMHLRGLPRAFYLAKNKDNDELYAERVKYDPDQSGRLIAKAERIIAADEAPARINDDPNSFDCRFCPSKGLCHDGEGLLRNCRTCLHSSPVSSGDWHCGRHNKTLSRDDQYAGCPNHLFLPSLIEGEQVDADPKAETVSYRMADGSTWVDGQKGGAA